VSSFCSLVLAYTPFRMPLAWCCRLFTCHLYLPSYEGVNSWHQQNTLYSHTYTIQLSPQVSYQYHKERLARFFSIANISRQCRYSNDSCVALRIYWHACRTHLVVIILIKDFRIGNFHSLTIHHRILFNIYNRIFFKYFGTFKYPMEPLSKDLNYVCIEK
jgi:hypothetical protein